jgi:glycosyltransferase involved in cell wall biosynthesis
VNRPLRVWLPTIRAGSGADVFVQRLAAGLERAGHIANVQWFDHRYELTPWRLRRFEPPIGTDVVHANSWTGFAFKRAILPLVVTEHQYVAHPAFAPYQGFLQGIYHRNFIERCMRSSYAAAAAVIAVSEFCAVPMRKKLGQPVQVIHNWVDSTMFSPSEHDLERMSAPRVTRLLFVGNPSRWKGADILPLLATTLGSGYEILCLGGLRRSFQQRDLPTNLRLLPRRAPAAMPEVYRSVDMALVPTRYEAFGYVALEAMASGLPVVGFDSSGTAEVCVNNETALLAPVDDVEVLASYARRLAHDPALRSRLGTAGRRRSLAVFSEPQAIEAYIDVYRRVIEGHD